jgi:hypothetical protein
LEERRGGRVASRGPLPPSLISLTLARTPTLPPGAEGMSPTMGGAKARHARAAARAKLVISP